MDDSGMICDEVVDLNDEAKLYDEANFNKKKQPVKCKVFMFYLDFY